MEFTRTDADRITRTETMVEQLHQVLLGADGQPGHVEKTDKRLKSLEATRERGKGVLWLGGLVLTAIEFLLHRGRG